MKCPKCKGKRYIKIWKRKRYIYELCLICIGTGEVERADGIDYNRKIAVPEHKAGQTGG